MANLITAPEALNDASWSKNACTVTPDDRAAPDGTTTADKIIVDSVGGSSTTVVASDTIIASGTFMCSMFFHADQSTWANMRTSGRGTKVDDVYFHLSGNGAVGATLGADNADQGITYYGNGWYRGWLQLANDADGAWSFFIGPANGDGDRNITRDGTSSIYAWGGLIESGSTLNDYTSVGGTLVLPQTGTSIISRSVTKDVTRGVTRNLWEKF